MYKYHFGTKCHRFLMRKISFFAFFFVNDWLSGVGYLTFTKTLTLNGTQAD